MLKFIGITCAKFQGVGVAGHCLYFLTVFVGSYGEEGALAEEIAVISVGCITQESSVEMAYVRLSIDVEDRRENHFIECCDRGAAELSGLQKEEPFAAQLKLF